MSVRFTEDQVRENNLKRQLERLRQTVNKLGANIDDAIDNPQKGPEPQCPVRHEPVAAPAREESHSGRVRVCITSYRRQLIDPDNLCPKYFIDCLRYAEIIPNDTAKDIELSVSQKKAKEDYTEITVQ